MAPARGFYIWCLKRLGQGNSGGARGMEASLSAGESREKVQLLNVFASRLQIRKMELRSQGSQAGSF